MDAEEYPRFCQSVHRQLYQRLERAGEDGYRFAPRGATQDVLHDDNLRNFFRSLAPPELPLDEPTYIMEETLIRRIKDRKLYDFLAVLLFATCSAAAANNFVERHVAIDAWHNEDRPSLPAEKSELAELFGNDVDAHKFRINQACFCTVVLLQRQEVRVASLDYQRVPYLDESSRGEGSFGRVFKVKIARGNFYSYNPTTRKQEYNAEPVEMARKDYIQSNRFPASGERDIMEKILSSSSRCDNIVENFGSLKVGQEIYSLFMPLAVCDLRKYMMEDNPARPATLEAKTDIIHCAEGLARGLRFLHHEMWTDEMEELVCFHMDLTPSNILIFYEMVQGKMRHIWKLSDFGMSCVRTRRRAQGGESERERDFTSWFVRRRPPPDPSLSAAPNERGDGTYLAPESVSTTPSMKTESDVWSLGCVLSILFAYLEEGSEGVINYQNARLQHPSSEGIDRFFLRGSSRFKQPKINPEVAKWHTRLIDKISRANINEAEAAATFLRGLEESVFVLERADRCNAKVVVEMLQTVYKGYRDAGVEPGPDRRRRRVSDALALTSMFSNRASSDRTRGRVKEWYLASSGDFKGCSISLDATLIAYWSDTKISLYSSDSLLTPGSEISPSAERPHDQDDGFWKSICLTPRYLVASTIGGNRCYIFNLEGGTPVGANLLKVDRVDMRVPIYKVAISPNSRWLACILQHPDNIRGRATLLHVRVLDLIEWARLPQNVAGGGSASGPTQIIPDKPPSQLPWGLVNLDWPAADVDRLSISNNQECHLVIRPELTARSREHKIPIVHVSLKLKTIDVLNIISGGFDSTGTVGLFTAFRPFTTRAACAVVTRERRLHIEQFHGNDSSHDLQIDIPNFRILRIMLNKNEDRMYALGTTSLKQQVQLSEFAVPRPRSHVSLEETVQLQGLSYGHSFAEAISDKGGNKHILVAALNGNRCTIYRIKITANH